MQHSLYVEPQFERLYLNCVRWRLVQKLCASRFFTTIFEEETIEAQVTPLAVGSQDAAFGGDSRDQQLTNPLPMEDLL